MNSLGVRTLFVKEMRRFLRVPGQTLLSPLITTSLYFLVFGWSLGSRIQEVGGVPYARFILPGLVLLGVLTNAYLNSASSLFVMKLQGTVVDVLVSPLSYAEILGAFVAAAVARGLIVGGIMWLVGALFTGFGVAHPVAALGLLVAVAAGFAALGFLTATWAGSFEQVNFLPTFVVTPLTFLGGVFYSAEMAPPALRWLTRANPIYYLVEALRWTVLGRADASPAVGFGAAVALAVGGLAVAYAVLRSGWRLRG
ncbi:MAG TPA: ABC transporter permease [Anaeromyxobacteraceae bacterium]|nr:ABC transporter permease [Anaeromyxobacteraceae bacterium]